jgi:pyruvate carboxylase
MATITKINKILVANRGEIAIRVLRAASELNITTVAVFTYEDRFSLHRYKADESYQIGADDDPLKPYLDIDEIVFLAKEKNVDAIHPGYGFLSENVDFVRKCKDENIIFIGPDAEVMENLGDKVAAKKIAIKANVPVIKDSRVPLLDIDIAREEAEYIGYPVIIKAAAGGGGRGMRVVRNESQLSLLFKEARSEAKTAFGDDTVFIEKFIQDPKHIEVQILGDNYGDIVHLYERDCSVQRRFQKVVEVAPSSSLPPKTIQDIRDYAVKLSEQVQYNNAGTVEFLVNPEYEIFFIEVNPRIQVEHTITEEVTGIDIVRTQILIAEGYELSDPRILLRSQSDVHCNGFAIQCRITSEDPTDNFKPDFGTIIAYRSAAGFGIRLDAGNAYTGVSISPFFDSLLVKVSAKGRTLKGAAYRLHRALREFRIRGVKTNIGFLENVITNPIFLSGKATVSFIDTHPELFNIKSWADSGTKALKFLGNIIINGNPDVKTIDPSRTFRTPTIPYFSSLEPYPKGSKDLLNELGPAGVADWLKNNPKIQFTDTTFRDAHQSLLATRVRTDDMLKVASGFARNHPEIFSMEVWGGATFDVCMRFIQENPWTRLQLLRQAMPNILLQMLIRGSNAVGYKAYPDNLIVRFIEKSWENGIDIFRIFDSLNWMEAMKVSIGAVRERTGGIAEASISFTGDLSDPNEKKYTLDYYLDLARQLEDEGAHILALKDMAGLLKPQAAEILIPALKNAIDIPIHLHTHDTSSNQTAMYLNAINAGVDVIDVALSSMSGLTSQPNFNALAAALEGHPRENKLDISSLNAYSNYWEDVREYYYPFESGLKAGTAEVYEHEIPGGQYSNLRPQAIALGLGDKFETIKKNYAIVNKMFGNIVKVTPSSKVVGDMALFMTANGLTEQDVMEQGNQLSFPDSVINFFKGDLGQPYGGFPKALQKMVLKGAKPYTDRPNAHLEPIDFENEIKEFRAELGEKLTELDFISYKLYPKVFKEYLESRNTYGPVYRIPTLAFLYGLQPGEDIQIPLSIGKTLSIKYLYRTEPDEKGYRKVSFELNGQSRAIKVKDESLDVEFISNRKAVGKNEIGAPLQGRLSKILVKAGDKVKTNDVLFVLEAMKMESSVVAIAPGKVKAILLAEGSLVEQDDMVVEMEE